MPRSIFCGRLIVSLALISFALVASPSSAAPERAKAQSPQPTRAEIEAREQVQQALLAETRGDNTLRAKRLATAWLDQPNLPEGNWQLGRVQIGGKWLTLAEAEALAVEDAILRKYRQQRDAAKNPKMLQALARWCVKARFDESSRLHYGQILARADATDEMRQEAVKRLDLQRVNGSWMTAEEIEVRKKEADAIQEALATWRPQLMALQLAINGEDFANRDNAIRELRQINDARIIPVLESYLLDGGDRFSEEAVKLLATFPQYEATEAIARYAIASDFVAARSLATVALKDRDLHEFCPLLLGSLIRPIQSRFQVFTDANGAIRYTYAIAQIGPDEDKVYITENAWMPIFYRLRAGQKPGGNWMKNPEYEFEHDNNVAAALNDAAVKNLQVMLANIHPSDTNRRIFKALAETTGAQNPPDAVAWWQWWKDYNEYHWPKSSQYAYSWTTTCSYLPYPWERERIHGSCFLAGTPVRTQTGSAAIETIQPGDRVLSQDQDTGELTYNVVVRTTLRPPAEMVKIKVGTEEIITTLGHPFWVSGHGWRMAKQLKEGDFLHSVGGAIRVDALQPMPKQPAHNLVVADFNTYFVGQQGLLVHDNEYRRPTRAIVPGLAVE